MSLKNMQVYWDIITFQAHGIRKVIESLIKSMKLKNLIKYKKNQVL